MAYQIRRLDYTEADTFFAALPKSERTLKAERIYDLLFPDSIRNDERDETSIGRSVFVTDDEE